MHTSQELTGSHGDVNPDALRRIEKEIMTIGQIVKTKFRGGSVDHVSYRSTNEDVARIAQLEVEKKELETKLKIAREAMNEYVTHLSEKVRAKGCIGRLSIDCPKVFKSYMAVVSRIHLLSHTRTLNTTTTTTTTTTKMHYLLNSKHIRSCTYIGVLAI